MSAWRAVGPLAELERDGRLIATFGGREIGVVPGGDGGLYGFRNRCPHHGAPICLGAVREREAGDPGRYELSGREVLRCPWHGWEFDAESGKCPDDERMRVKTYPVRVRDGTVEVLA